MAVLDITMEIGIVNPLDESTQWQCHYIIAPNWITEKENRLVYSGLCDDNLDTGKFRSCWAHEIYYLLQFQLSDSDSIGWNILQGKFEQRKVAKSISKVE